MMKKLCLLIWMMLLAVNVFAILPNSVVKQSGLAPMNGQLVDDDGNVVNQVNSVSKVQFTHDFSSGNLAWLSAFGFTCRIMEIEIHFAEPVTGSLIISKKYADGTTTVVRKIATLSGNQDVVFNDVIFLDKGSQLLITCDTPDPLTTAVVGVSYSRLVF